MILEDLVDLVDQRIILQRDTLRISLLSMTLSISGSSYSSDGRLRFCFRESVLN
jgi:hypothetical protein